MTPEQDQLRCIGWIIMLLFIGIVLPLLASCTTPQVVVKYKCPPLSPAPLSAVDALVLDAQKNPSTGAWVVDLDRHYQKCDIINAQPKGKT